MKKILITGANGFIGSHLVQYFVNKKYSVYALDIIKSSNENVKSYQIDMIKDDLSSFVYEIKPEIIIHCAGSASVPLSIENPQQDFDKNVIVLFRFLDALKKNNLKPIFLFLSSAAVYGNPRTMPIKESAINKPISPYGLNKKICEDICNFYREQENPNIKILRLFSVYGIGLKKQLFWDMYQNITKKGNLELFGTGNETRDFINIEDLVEIVYLIINNKGHIFNIANGFEISIKEVANIFLALLGKSMNSLSFVGNIRLGDPTNWVADITKIKKIGYNQKITITAGIEKYIAWIQKYEKM